MVCVYQASVQPLSTDIFEDDLLIQQDESNEETILVESITIESSTESSTTEETTNEDF